MIQYGIFEEDGRVVGEFETMEAGLEALKALGDGEVTPYARGEEGYYTAHYQLERGLYSRVCRGRIELKWKDGEPVVPISATDLGLIIAYRPCRELRELLVTLDTARARELFDSFTPEPVVWNAETRTMTVDLCVLETEDTSGDCDVQLLYRCAAFEPETLLTRDEKCDIMQTVPERSEHMSTDKNSEICECESFFEGEPIDGDWTVEDVIEIFQTYPNAKIAAEELPMEVFWEAIQVLAERGEQALSEKLLELYGKTVIDLYFDFSAPADGHSFRCDPDLPRYGYSFDAMYAYGQYLGRKKDGDYTSVSDRCSAFELCLADVGVRDIDRTLERWPDLRVALSGDPFSLLSAEDCVELGIAYLHGTKQLPKDESRACECFESAKDSLYTDPYGYAECYNYECDIALAACYLYGIGVDEDEASAGAAMADALETCELLGYEPDDVTDFLEEMQRVMGLDDKTPTLLEFYEENFD